MIKSFNVLSNNQRGQNIQSTNNIMEVPENFPFPFTPYKIQEDFMKNLWSCLDNGNLGIFESPTGTGKSLSIICGALKWLTDRETWLKEDIIAEIANLDNELEEIKKKNANDWFTEQTEQIALNKTRRVVQAKLEAIDRRTERRKKFYDKVKRVDDSKKNIRFKSKTVKGENDKNNTDLLDEISIEKNNLDDDLLLEELDLNSDGSDKEEAENEPAKYTQIFFCSRTHSQLSQFVGELQRSPYSQEVSVVPIASRQNYCINKEVKRLRHVNLINERCLQLQRKKKTTSKKEKDLKRSKISTSCPFMPGDQSLMIAEIVTKIQDVEDVAKKGTEHETCGYYASRKSLQDGQVILVPYNTILHKNTRVSSGIDLRDNVLIIDEAHNLLEAIERMHSATITGRNILHCYSQLTQYQKRFESMFSAKCVLYLGQLSFCLRKLINVLGGTSKSRATDKLSTVKPPKVYDIVDFEVFAEIDTVNVFELLDFIKNSKLIHKLQGYMEKYSDDLKINPVTVAKTGVSAFLNVLQAKDDKYSEVSLVEKDNINEDTSNNPLMAIVSFLESLKSSNDDGRIFVIPAVTIGQGTIKFLLMNPAAHFHDIVKEARSIVLAGGTMEPISEFVDQLFINAGAEPKRIVTFSCDHVIPKENILTRIVTRGPTGVAFEFNYQNRQNPELLNELGRTLQNLCNVVPGGIVVFLPSYGYEDTLNKHLEKQGFITKIRVKKQVYREPKLASQVNTILENYASDVKNPKSPQNGALLFSVVGGKLSEGLNFSDDLGRCVVVVGMPYPNIKSPELQEKMKYLNENVKPGAGSTYYENSCMKAVNQCIGRAVRHINDYSTVVLLDKRYANKKSSLPGWIQRTLMVNDTFSTTIGDVAKFFAARRRKAAETT